MSRRRYADLARHEREIKAHESFNDAIFADDTESALLGCVYVDPPERTGADAEVAWWVIDPLVGSELETTLDEAIPGRPAREWPLTRPRYLGGDPSPGPDQRERSR